jgi:phosphatidylcholine synthase
VVERLSQTSQPDRFALVAAACVHLYTAAGAVLAFIGVRAVLLQDEKSAFVAMLAATVIDATDGTLARWARVKEVLPSVDGAAIDDIVDYLTFVFLPMFLIQRTGGLPASIGIIVVGVVLISSLFGFTAADAKTTDHFFTGFPSYWNIVVLYLYVFRTPPAVNALLLVILSAMIFVRVRYVYPSRTPTLRTLTMTLAWVWGITIALLVWWLPSPPRWLAIVSLVFPVYYIVLSLILNTRVRHARSS